MSTTTKVNKTTDAVFYGLVTAFGVGLTTLCVYGYRKYRNCTGTTLTEEYEVMEVEYIDDVMPPLIEEELCDIVDLPPPSLLVRQTGVTLTPELGEVAAPARSPSPKSIFDQDYPDQAL